AILPQFEVIDDFRLKQVTQIRTSRKVIARKQLLRHTRPAEHVASLHQEHLQTGARQIRRRDESVMTAAENDDILIAAHRQVIGIPVRKADRSVWEVSGSC